MSNRPQRQRKDIPERRRAPPATVRKEQIAPDVTLTPAEHTLDGHMGSLNKSRLNSTTLVQEGNGVPTHAAERSTQYQDLDTNKVYVNADGATTWVEIGSAAPGSDTDAIHDNVAGEIAAITEKATPVDADLIVIEDSAAGNAKKRVQVGNLPAGGVTDADYLVGTAHAGLSAEIVVGTTPAGELGGTWASPTVDPGHAAGTYHEFDEMAAPGTPAAAKVRVYAKADGKMYRKDDAGTEAELGGGGGASSATYTLPARSGMPTLTNGCNDAVQIEMTNQDTNVIVADFADAVDRSISFEVVMPDNWNAGTVRIQVSWISAATSGICLWRARAGSFIDGQALDTALGGYVALTDTALSPTNDVMVSPEGTMTFANAAAGPAIIEINRNGSAAGDTLSATARLWQVKLEFDLS